MFVVFSAISCSYWSCRIARVSASVTRRRTAADFLDVKQDEVDLEGDDVPDRAGSGQLSRAAVHCDRHVVCSRCGSRQ